MHTLPSLVGIVLEHVFSQPRMRPPVGQIDIGAINRSMSTGLVEGMSAGCDGLTCVPRAPAYSIIMPRGLAKGFYVDTGLGHSRERGIKLSACASYAYIQVRCNSPLCFIHYHILYAHTASAIANDRYGKWSSIPVSFLLLYTWKNSISTYFSFWRHLAVD